MITEIIVLVLDTYKGLSHLIIYNHSIFFPLALFVHSVARMTKS